MPETALLLTPMHYLYLIGVIVILTVMILRKEDVYKRQVLIIFLMEVNVN